MSTNVIYNGLVLHENDLDSYATNLHGTLNSSYERSVAVVENTFMLCLDNNKLKIFEYLLNNARSLSVETKEIVFQTALMQKKHDIVRIYEKEAPEITGIFYERLLKQSIKNNDDILFDSLIDVNCGLIETSILLLITEVLLLNPNHEDFSILLDRICNVFSKLTDDKENDVTKMCRGRALVLAASLDDEKKVASLLKDKKPIDPSDLENAYNLALPNGQAKRIIANAGSLEMKIEREVMDPINQLQNTVNKKIGVAKHKIEEVATTANGAAGFVASMPARGMVYAIDQFFISTVKTFKKN